MAKFSPLMVAPPLIFAGLAAMMFFGMYRDDPDSLPSVFEGKAAPEIAAEPLGDLATFDRSVLNEPGVKIVNFFASWCAPCRAEHPALIELAKTVPVYGVNRDVTEKDAMGFLDELGNPYKAVTYDPGGRKSLDWGVYGLPETFVIDGKGNVVLRFAGPIQRVMDSTIWPAVQKAGQPE
ncbi:DsbE family thiol:disulfide interchange protein [Oceaniglobus ichthyenteri]|uniref:DsbE family thiol:disulfide interchange protein n=1 Tax=Oceaniglobus ichthyenteri TaxID=2136177 RepID=UPI000D363322|nr:DsbE family thiol:disulfide interchange protein [Oceaniglobus ichthyenteri]